VAENKVAPMYQKKQATALPQTSLVFEGTYVRLLLHRSWDTTPARSAGRSGRVPQSSRGRSLRAGAKRSHAHP
jgi:hypothetical protein